MSGEVMTGAEMVIRAFQDQGVDTLFGYPGGAVLPIYDALFHQNAVKHILVRHEQGAVHAAEGYARSSGKVGCVLVTSGPGATNIVTGLTDAMLDSIPLVCITGQVPTHLIGTDAFQECDTVGITRHCTKHNYLVKSIDDLPRILHEAFYVAANGRPGPVVVDLPKDIQFASGLYERPEIASHKTYRPAVKGDADRIRAAVELMATARRPVFYTGGGVINSGPGGLAPAARTRPRDRLPGHLDADGARRLSGHGREVPGHARHARDLRGQPRDARVRRDDLRRRPVRRPDHRPARRVLAVLQEDPHRRRRLLDQQGGQGRCRDRRRLRLGARRHAGGVARPAVAARQVQPRRVVPEDRGPGRRATASPTGRRARSSSRNTPCSASTRPARIARPTSPPRSASTRCGRPSTSSTTSRTAG